MSGYCETHDVLFVHVPKTAGTSMERAPFVAGAGHEPYWALPASDRQRAGFSFACVRDPYDRFVSAVTAGMYRQLRERGEQPRNDAEREHTFERARQLVTNATLLMDRDGPLELSVGEHWRILGSDGDPLPHLDGFPFPIHFLPQWYYLAAPGLERIGVEHLIRFESLADGWAEVCRRVGVQHELPHLRNAQQDRGFGHEDFLTDAARAVVAKLYARDFEWFGYAP